MTDRGPHNRNSLQHHLIFTLSFTIYLLVGLGVRLIPAFLRGRQRRSLFAEARAASDTIAQLAFAG